MEFIFIRLSSNFYDPRQRIQVNKIIIYYINGQIIKKENTLQTEYYLGELVQNLRKSKDLIETIEISHDDNKTYIKGYNSKDIKVESMILQMKNNLKI